MIISCEFNTILAVLYSLLFFMVNGKSYNYINIKDVTPKVCFS